MKRLMLAIMSNANDQVVSMLLAAGARVNERTPDGGATALMLAAVGTSDIESIQLLVKAGAGINDRIDDGRTALMLAAQYSMSPPVVTALLLSGADGSLVTPDGRTTFDFAGHNRIMPQTAAYAQLRAAAQKARKK